MPSGIYKHKKGRKMSDETKLKMSIARIGIKLSDETKSKMSIARIGIKLLEEIKKKMSESHKGKKHSDETRKKMSKAIFKGDNVGYRAVHKWVELLKGKATEYKCVDCGKQAEHWSNINNHIYRRILSDYVPRCTKCHRIFDIKNNQKSKSII